MGQYIGGAAWPPRAATGRISTEEGWKQIGYWELKGQKKTPPFEINGEWRVRYFVTGQFNMMGSIFSSLTQAVGAADKVFELMHRKPKVKPWSGRETGEGEEGGGLTKLRGKYEGDYPDSCKGEVKLGEIGRELKKLLDKLTQQCVIRFSNRRFRNHVLPCKTQEEGIGQYGFHRQPR